MMLWITRLVTLALLLVIAALTATSLPVLFGGHLEHRLLLAHMMASGAMVFLLPVFGLLWMFRSAPGPTQRLLAWLILASGFVTILTVFACMLPIAGTDEMHALIKWHGYAGFTLAVIAILFLLLRPFRRPVNSPNQ